MRTFVILFCLCELVSCRKYLDAKSNLQLATPSTLDNLQAILNNVGQLNKGSGVLNTGSDEYYLSADTWNSIFDVGAKDGYLWRDSAQTQDDWNGLYGSVFMANTVLDHLPGFLSAPNELSKRKAIEGAALFFRSFYFWQLLQVYAPVNDSLHAASQPGIVLRLNADFNAASVRSTVAQGYAQVVSDLLHSVSLLPLQSQFKTQPNVAAGYALLARVQLSMGNYSQAMAAADSALQVYSTLLNYTALSPADPFPFALFNDEVIFHATSIYTEAVYNVNYHIDSVLYGLYGPHDLRKDLFFMDKGDGSFTFRGAYNASNYGEFFDGLAVDELYLIRAECAARSGDVITTAAALNTLLEKRMETGYFIPVSFMDASSALAFVLSERRKELVFRGLRWTDIRRLNVQGAGIVLSRILNNTAYVLQPNDLRYTWLIPQAVIDLTHMPQNLR